nr:hypothetical protein [Pseudomonas fulva]
MTTASTLELLLFNQVAIRAALEELSLWVSHPGSTATHDNVVTGLATLDLNAEAFLSALKRLRSYAIP